MITHIIIKLHSGEQVMAALEDDGDGYIEVSVPIVISTTQFQDNEHIHEHITAKPLCQFSSDKIYRIPKSGILFYKELHQVMIPHYIRIVNSYEDSALITSQKQGDAELSIEEVRDRIDSLEDVFKETERSDIEKRVYIEGNNTIH